MVPTSHDFASFSCVTHTHTLTDKPINRDRALTHTPTRTYQHKKREHYCALVGDKCLWVDGMGLNACDTLKDPLLVSYSPKNVKIPMAC